MHTTTIQSAQSLGVFRDRRPSRWSTRLCSILSSRWYRKNDGPKHDSLNRFGGRLLADVGLYCEHRIRNPQNRTDQQQASPLPVALLAMWMPRI
jgi:hypothetical protein